MKTKYSSFCNNGIAEGCKYCVKGEKLVIFISGICSRNCYYCSLSNKRKNKDLIYANERPCKDPNDAINEAIVSNATSAGITGGDPLLYLERTIKYAKALKKKFGKSFHIHIYLPTKLVTKDNLKQLSTCIDEVRFHPDFLCSDGTNKDIDMKKIKLASQFFKKKDIGIELPGIPEKKQDILDFVISLKDYIGFLNINELEISETNFNIMTDKYDLKEGGYVIDSSKKASLWILDQLKNKKSKLFVHFCTADLKNHYQFENRIKRHKIIKFGKRTSEGLVKYLTIYKKNGYDLDKIKKDLNKKEYHYDKKKERLILSENLAKKLLKIYRITLVEEYPTFDRMETESDLIN